MPRYVITLEAYVTAPSPEEAENLYYDPDGDVKAYVIQVDEVAPERLRVPPLPEQEGWHR
jgi:hypothetical protein